MHALSLHIFAAAKSPFFIYVAFQHTHKPQFAGKQFSNSTLRGAFGDALAELDWGVGEVMQALKDANVENNTLVFFSSDNGYYNTNSYKFVFFLRKSCLMHGLGQVRIKLICLSSVYMGPGYTVESPSLPLGTVLLTSYRPALYQEILGGNAGPLRCGKGTTWEGGQRVPGIVHWPGKIEPGRTFEVQTAISVVTGIINQRLYDAI